MKEIILLKEGEIALKGLNKRTFEEAFIKNLRHRLKPLGKFDYTRSQSMIYCEPLEDTIDMDEAVLRASRVFGAAAICRAMITERILRLSAVTHWNTAARSFPAHAHSRFRQSAPTSVSL